jgi:hypothetical protein
MYKLIQWFSCVGSTSSSYLLYLIKWYGPPSINFDVAHACYTPVPEVGVNQLYILLDFMF